MSDFGKPPTAKQLVAEARIDGRFGVVLQLEHSRDILVMAEELRAARAALVIARTSVNGGFGAAGVVRDAIERINNVLGNEPETPEERS
jgi:hypothetical protein